MNNASALGERLVPVAGRHRVTGQRQSVVVASRTSPEGPWDPTKIPRIQYLLSLVPDQVKLVMVPKVQVKSLFKAIDLSRDLRTRLSK
jgi:hypothetical protein